MAVYKALIQDTNGMESMERTIEAKDKEHANSVALEMAAKMTKEYGGDWRVTRLDPA